MESGQPATGNSMFNGMRQPSRDGTSRMTRECQARFCEGLPGPTRQERPKMHRWHPVRIYPALRTLIATVAMSLMCQPTALLLARTAIAFPHFNAKISFRKTRTSSRACLLAASW